MFLSEERPDVYQAQVGTFYEPFANRDSTRHPEHSFATPHGFGVFFFQCGVMRSSEWYVKNSLTLLFKRTVSRLCIRYQTYGYKTNDIMCGKGRSGYFLSTCNRAIDYQISSICRKPSGPDL